MFNCSVQYQIEVAGLSIGGVVNKSEEGSFAHAPTLAAGVDGTLSTRSSNTAGVLTLGAGHGLTDADTIDVHWTDADGLHCVAYDCTISTYDSTTVTFTGASGVVLPAQDYAIVAGERITIDSDWSGDLLELIGMSADQDWHAEFQENDADSLLALTMDAGEPVAWLADQGITNPWAGDAVGKIVISNGSIVAASVQIGGLYDSVS